MRSQEDASSLAAAELGRAVRAARTGDLANAEELCRSLLATPSAYGAALLLGEVLVAQNRELQALEAFDFAVALAPSDALAQTRAACVRLRRELGAKPPPAPAGSARVVQMRTLGADGRFGNQLLQYGFARLYAHRAAACCETPEWIGRYLYAGTEDPLPSRMLPTIRESDVDLFSALRGDTIGPVNCDLQGFFSNHTRDWGSLAQPFRGLFELVPALKTRFAGVLEALRTRGRTLVAIHLRRTDFGYGPFWVAPTSWYVAWLEALWPTLDAPLLWISTDDPRSAVRLKAFAPTLASDVTNGLEAAPFLLDHYILSQADHLAISNSTFSVTAAMLNATALSFMRPDPRSRALIPFDPWSTQVLLQATPEPEAAAAETGLIRRVITPKATVAHIGEFCSPWTNIVRAEYPTLKVHELEPDERIGDLLQQLRHLNHVRLDAAIPADQFLVGAAASLKSARIDFVHLAPGYQDAAALCAALLKYGYGMFRLTDEGGLQAVDLPRAAEPVIFAHTRLRRLLAGVGTASLELVAMCHKYDVRVDTVVHVGAHEGQELPTYDALAARRVVFVEANPQVYDRLRARVAGRADVITIQRAIADSRGTRILQLASFDENSSLLPLHIHRLVYPAITPAGTVEVAASTLDGLIEELGLDNEQLSLLCLDVKGAEHLVLHGASRVLRHVAAVQAEVYFAEMYRGGAMIEDIEQILAAAGFERVDLLSGFHTTCADGFYVRRRVETSLVGAPSL